MLLFLTLKNDDDDESLKGAINSSFIRYLNESDYYADEGFPTLISMDDNQEIYVKETVEQIKRMLQPSFLPPKV